MRVVRYIVLVTGSSVLGAVMSAVMASLVEFFKAGVLLGLDAFELVGAVIGGVMGCCSVMKLEGLGSFMTDQQVLGATVYRYRHKIIEESYFDYVFFFSAFALFLVSLWAYNPAMESDTLVSDVLCMALALGGASATGFSILKLSEHLG